MENRRPVLTSIVMDDITSGHFDRELGKITRDPEYTEYTAMELKAVLTDRVVDNLLTEPRCALKWVFRAAIIVLVAILAVAITYN